MGQGTSSEAVDENATKIMITGQPDAGRSTLLRKLSGEKKFDFYNSLIFKMKSKHKDLVFSSVDLTRTGGRYAAWPMYSQLYRNMDAVIFVEDSHDRHTETEERRLYLLNAVMLDEGEQAPSHLPLLVLADKHDLPGALSIEQLSSELGLERLCQDRVEILPTSLETDEGLPEIEDWLDRQRSRKNQELLQNALLKPLHKAVPAPAKSVSSKMLSALKEAFALGKKKGAQ